MVLHLTLGLILVLVPDPVALLVLVPLPEVVLSQGQFQQLKRLTSKLCSPPFTMLAGLSTRVWCPRECQILRLTSRLVSRFRLSEEWAFSSCKFQCLWPVGTSFLKFTLGHHYCRDKKSGNKSVALKSLD